MARRGTRRSVARRRLLLAPLAALPLFALLAIGWPDTGRIAHNVHVAGVPVGGMSTPDATAAVSTQWLANLPPRVVLRWPEGSHSAPVSTLGVTRDIATAVQQACGVGNTGNLVNRAAARAWLYARPANVAVSTRVDRQVLAQALRHVAALASRPPKDATVRLVGEDVRVQPGQAGLAVDTRTSATNLTKSLQDPQLAEFDLTVVPVPPDVTADELGHIETVLASYTTHFRPSQENRTHNLSLAVKALRSVVLMPGDTFSLNGRVGPRVSERGYRDAPIFVNGEVEPQTGGGICQVASTLYNAVLLAGLNVIERHHHSRPVDYAPAGRDATVYWGQYDLRFSNNLAHPVMITGAISDDTVTVRVVGSREDKLSVEINRSGLAKLDYTTKEVPDPELAVGKRKVEKPGRRGASVTVTRTIRRPGGQPRTETLHTDVYAAANAEVRVGAKKPDVPPIPPDGLDAATTAAEGNDAPAAAKPAAPTRRSGASAHGDGEADDHQAEQPRRATPKGKLKRAIAPVG